MNESKLSSLSSKPILFNTISFRFSFERSHCIDETNPFYGRVKKNQLNEHDLEQFFQRFSGVFLVPDMN